MNDSYTPRRPAVLKTEPDYRPGGKVLDNPRRLAKLRSCGSPSDAFSGEAAQTHEHLMQASYISKESKTSHTGPF